MSFPRNGEQIDECPDMLRLLKDIESPSIKAMLVVDVQRLYRGDLLLRFFYRVPIQDCKKECFTLAEKKDEADVVRMIFDWYCNKDIGVTAICRRLESMNI